MHRATAEFNSNRWLFHNGDEVIYRSGTVGKDRRVDPGAHFYQAVLVDKNGFFSAVLKKFSPGQEEIEIVVRDRAGNTSNVVGVLTFMEVSVFLDEIPQRLAFHLLNAERADAENLGQAIIDMRAEVRLCIRCFNVTAEEQCSICVDPRRDPAVICVVERAQDIPVLERTQEFTGRYHVLGGAISPIEGIGPDQLRMRELVGRIEIEGVKEVIAATNPTVEGDTTALYLSRLLNPLDVRVTRLASGLPVGGDLDYADEITLGRALVVRKEI